MDTHPDLRTRLEALSEEIKADLRRPKGRWGMHGHSAVDDDYFAALEYVVKKIDAILNETPNA